MPSCTAFLLSGTELRCLSRACMCSQPRQCSSMADVPPPEAARTKFVPQTKELFSGPQRTMAGLTSQFLPSCRHLSSRSPAASTSYTATAVSLALRSMVETLWPPVQRPCREHTVLQFEVLPKQKHIRPCGLHKLLPHGALRYDLLMAVPIIAVAVLARAQISDARFEYHRADLLSCRLWVHTEFAETVSRSRTGSR